MTTCHHSSCRSSVGVCWWHPPSSPEDRGSQQSHVPTLSPWHVAPSGSPTSTHTWIHKHTLAKTLPRSSWSWSLLRRQLSFQASLFLHWPNEPTDKWPAVKIWLFSRYVWLLPRNAIQMFGMYSSSLRQKATQQKCWWWTCSFKLSMDQHLGSGDVQHHPRDSGPVHGGSDSGLPT